MTRSSPTADAPLRARKDRRVWLAAFTLSVITFAIFSPSLQNGFVNFDDHGYITENRNVLGGLSASSVAWAFTTGAMSNWHPLTWISYLIDVSLYGLNPAGHHFSSLLLHSLNAALALFCAMALTRTLSVALPAAALFALHPLRVESVTWIAERKDVLSGLFFFAAILLWIAFVHRQDRTLKLGALVCFTAGLLAKPMLVTLPALLIVIDVCFLRRSARTAREWRALFSEKAPFFVLAAVSSLVTVLVQTDAMTDVESYGWRARVAAVPVHLVRYLELTAWPVGLSPLYPLDKAGYGAFTVSGAVILLVAITAVALRFRRAEPVFLGGWLWFAGTLVPVLGLLQAGQAAVADRYTYLPHLGLFLAISSAATRVSRVYGPLLLGVVVVALCPVTVTQTSVWSSTQTLFEHAVKHAPGSALSQDALAGELLEKGDLQRAERHAMRAHELAPHNPRYANRLAQVLSVKGEDDQAEALLWTTVKRHPDSARAWFYLSALERKDGRAKDAREHLLRALVLSEGSDDELHAQVLSIAISAGFVRTSVTE